MRQRTPSPATSRSLTTSVVGLTVSAATSRLPGALTQLITSLPHRDLLPPRPPERLLDRYSGDRGDLDFELDDGRLALRFAGRGTLHSLGPRGDRLFRIAYGLVAGERLVVTVTAGGEVKSLVIGRSVYAPCLHPS